MASSVAGGRGRVHVEAERRWEEESGEGQQEDREGRRRLAGGRRRGEH